MWWIKTVLCLLDHFIHQHVCYENASAMVFSCAAVCHTSQGFEVNHSFATCGYCTCYIIHRAYIIQWASVVILWAIWYSLSWVCIIIIRCYVLLWQLNCFVVWSNYMWVNGQSVNLKALIKVFVCLNMQHCELTPFRLFCLPWRWLSAEDFPFKDQQLCLLPLNPSSFLDKAQKRQEKCFLLMYLQSMLATKSCRLLYTFKRALQRWSYIFKCSFNRLFLQISQGGPEFTWNSLNILSLGKSCLWGVIFHFFFFFCFLLSIQFVNKPKKKNNNIGFNIFCHSSICVGKFQCGFIPVWIHGNDYKY